MGIPSPSKESVVMATGRRYVKNRQPRKEMSWYGAYQYNRTCIHEIERHEEELKNDPERLTKDFLVALTGVVYKRSWT